MRVGVITFPGSLDDHDALEAIRAVGAEAVALWHASTDLEDVDGIVLPGGFSYGDYLRCGAVAFRSPAMSAVREFAAGGGPVLGICNGFQILCESGLLPGALLRNVGLRFTCRSVALEVAATDTPWTAAYEPRQRITIPVKNGEGRYHADEDTLDRIEREGRVVLRYLDNPNGSARDIAGVANERGNVVGMMPHPEHAIDPVLGRGSHGRGVFASLLQWAGAPA